MKDKLLNNKRIIFIILGLIIVIILGVVIIYGNRDKDKSFISNNEIKELIDNSNVELVFVYDSSKDNYEFIEEYLNNYKINYKKYDLNKINDEEYDKLLSIVNIDKDLFGTPAILYIYAGGVKSNVINITNIAVVEQFAKDYDLISEENKKFVPKKKKDKK